MRRPDPKTWILPALVVVFINGCNGREEPTCCFWMEYTLVGPMGAR